MLRTFIAGMAAAAALHASGTLSIIDPQGRPQGLCPLKHTAVKAEISGPVARVSVTQTFTNPGTEKIEAVYAFPLPHAAAVDDMMMTVGGRTIKGTIKRREEARAIYNAARNAGQMAALLDQERPNIFTQAVANILPGQQVRIEIRYIERLDYEAGQYSFVFPMVVGPRYNPSGLADARRIPNGRTAAPLGTRAGHDISIEVAVDAGVPIDALRSETHEVAVERPSAPRAVVRLKNQATIPNKDFVLRYDAAGRSIQDAVLAHADGKGGGYFTLLLQPPERVAPVDATPKELVFVLDTSGSMMGFPIEKAKETMRLALNALNPRDTFNLITFAGDTHILFPAPVRATPENLARATEFLATRQGGGGTEMMKAIRAALAPSGDRDAIRVVCFMTDGFVGNDLEILAEIRRNAGARVFSFGIGNSVNRFLLDGMAREARGEVEYVLLESSGSEAARRFHERVRNPLLTDIRVEWNGLPVHEVYPKRIPDLFGAKPVAIAGRYTAAASGKVTLRGTLGGRAFTREIAVNLPAAEARHEAVAPLWARAAVDDLMAQDYNGVTKKEEIVAIALKHRLMTQHTSFVAVEEKIVTEGGRPKRVEVPLEMPDGVAHEGIVGGKAMQFDAGRLAAPRRAMASGVVGGVPGGVPGGVIGGIIGGGAAEMVRVEPLPAPPAPPPVLKDAPRPKLHPALAAMAPTDDPVKVAVQLADASEATLAALKSLGFEVLEKRSGTLLVGRIAARSLRGLERLKAVLKVDPA